MCCQNEVLSSAPVATIPKQILKAPPLDTANPTQAHSYLPVPASSAKLKSASSTSSSGTPTSPPSHAALPSAAAHTTPGPQIFGRFLPSRAICQKKSWTHIFSTLSNLRRNWNSCYRDQWRRSTGGCFLTCQLGAMTWQTWAHALMLSRYLSSHSRSPQR